MLSMFHLNTHHVCNHCVSRKVSVAIAVPLARSWIPRRAATLVVTAGKLAKTEDDDDDDDGEAPVAGKALRVERLLANLGYGKRRECQVLVKKGRITTKDGCKLKVGDKVCWGDVVLDGEELDPPSPLVVALHKPTGYVVTSPDDENISDPVVYDLLPYRFGRRRPFLSSVGRLDKDTSGLLLLTDDGAMLHRINSPRRGIWKVYEATLADSMTTKQAEAAARKFASGSLVLEGDHTPLLPAKLELMGDGRVRVAICEGKYHQIRRMLAAVGSQVATLHRVSVGGLSLGSLPEAEWRFLSGQEMQRVFEGPSTEEILAGAATAAPAAAAAAAAIVDGVGSGSNRSRSSSSNSDVEGGVGAGYRGASASASPGNLEPRRVTKKKKGHNQPKQGRATVAEDVEDHSSEDGEEEDFGLLPYDSGSEGGRRRGVAEHNGDGDEAGGHGPGVRSSHSQRRLQRRGLTARQGALHDAKLESLDEQLNPDMYDNVAAADGGLSAGAGRGVRKYLDEEKLRRRRDELRQMLPF